MSHSNLKSSAISGVVWSFIDRFVNQAVQFSVTIILARLLAPDDFGLLGMLTIFLLLAGTIIDCGFSQALIQKKDRNEIDFSTVFYINIVIALVIYLVLFLSAPIIASFYKAPELVSLSRVLFLTLIVNALYVVQDTRLTIQLNFKAKAKLNFFATAIGGITAAISAYLGSGYWALVYQSLITSIIYLLLITMIYQWRPAWVFSRKSCSALFGFGSKLLLASLLSTFTNNLAAMLIGRFFSPQVLGYYTQGRKYPELVSLTVTGILQKVTFPVLASIQDDKQRMIAVYKRVLMMSAFFVIPTMTGLALIAKPFVLFFLTEKWLPAVPVIQGLCFAAIFTPINAVNLNLLTATGRSDLFLRVDALKIPFALAMIAVTVPYGINAVVAGQIGLKILSFIFNTYYPGKLYNYGALNQIRDIAPVILATIGMSGVVFFIDLDNPLLQVLVSITAGFFSFLGFSWVLKVDSLFEIITLSKQKLNTGSI